MTSSSRSCPVRRRADAVPARQEAGERLGGHRLDLAAQPRQRAAAQGAQDLGVGELVLGAAGPEGALQQRAGLDQGAEPLAGRATARSPSAQPARPP